MMRTDFQGESLLETSKELAEWLEGMLPNIEPPLCPFCIQDAKDMLSLFAMPKVHVVRVVFSTRCLHGEDSST